ncbi:MAG: ATP-dependent 6-phosphofructokinase [Gemmatimonadota bacterium]|nr:MAG: ATP-dependent 6-phosphofructokinase [Gemmatimonadota bacterium]
MDTSSFPSAGELLVQSLGACDVPSPLLGTGAPFVASERRILLPSDITELEPFLKSGRTPPSFEAAGPRQTICFHPTRVTAGLVTCGGLCPGLNDVVRAIVLTLTYTYGVRRILGFCYGYAGLASEPRHGPVELTTDMVESIHEHGGTILGSSRGPQDVGEMVDTLEQRGVDILFTIGGDGTLRGASALSLEIDRRGSTIAVIGVPKTIDNDLAWTVRTFGFSTAVEAARNPILAAHSEARGAWNGVGLVKLMGRHSGFVAAHATLANADVNFCLVPEVQFALEGERGFLAALEQRLDLKHHAVIVVAEGAGQDLLEGAAIDKDASGNVKLGDIGVFLRDAIRRHFASRSTPVDVKYIDPSYLIRSVPADANDSEFCLLLGQHAVHAGMAGRTNMVVSYWNRNYVHVPIPVAVAARRRLDPGGQIWRGVLEATGQPRSML